MEQSCLLPPPNRFVCLGGVKIAEDDPLRRVDDALLTVRGMQHTPSDETTAIYYVWWHP